MRCMGEKWADIFLYIGIWENFPFFWYENVVAYIVALNVSAVFETWFTLAKVEKPKY